MRHKKISSLLGAYYDGELKEKERIVVEKHLQECAECRSELNLIKEIDSLSSKPLHEPEKNYWSYFVERVKIRIFEREKEGVRKKEISLFFRPHFMRLGVAMASIILIAILSIFYVESLKSTKVKVLSQKESLPSEKIVEKDNEKILKPGETLTPGPKEKERKLSPSVKPEAEKSIAENLEKIEQVKERAEKVEEAESFEKKPILFERVKDEELSKEEEIYQRGLRFEKEGKYNEALKNYQSILYKYPSGKRAPQAQFQINTISSFQWDKSNEESSLRKKIKSWEDFIKNYPDSKLIPSAKKNLAEAYYQLAIFAKNQEEIEGAIMAIEDFLRICTEDKDREKFEKMLKEIMEIRRIP